MADIMDSIPDADIRVTSFRRGLGSPVVRSIMHIPTGISVETEGSAVYALECLRHEVAAHNRRWQEHQDHGTYCNGP